MRRAVEFAGREIINQRQPVRWGSLLARHYARVFPEKELAERSRYQRVFSGGWP